MNTIELEARVLRIVDAAASGHPVEDSLVELKSELPDYQKAARRLAAHCNSARSEHVLWIIGVDEKTGAVGAACQDRAEWWPKVVSQFAGVHPILEKDLVVHTQAGSVLALLFSAGRAPYLTVNPQFGHVSGAAIEREVPWRDGTRTRTATREEMLLMLAAIARIPRLELLDGQLIWSPPDEKPYDPLTNEGGNPGIWRFQLSLYIEPLGRDPIVIPFHRLSASIRSASWSDSSVVRDLALQPLRMRYRPGDGPVFPTDTRLSRTIDATPTEALVSGPGKMTLSGWFPLPTRDQTSDADIECVLRIQVVGSHTPISISMRFVHDLPHMWYCASRGIV